MIIVGITGQTGAGKTTLLQGIQQLHGDILDCDALYWNLLAEDKALQRCLKETFGDISSESGEIDRKKLGAKVFSNPEKLKQLNAITHPIILNKIEEWLELCKKKGYTIVGIDAIALIESGLNEKCDYTLAVLAPESTRIARIMARDSISEDYARTRIKAQQAETFYKENSDFLLENNYAKQEEFSKYTQDFLENLLKKTQNKGE